MDSFTSRIQACAVYELQINELHTANAYGVYKRNAKRKQILRYLWYFKNSKLLRGDFVEKSSFSGTERVSRKPH